MPPVESLNNVGHTPLVKVKLKSLNYIDLFIKLESFNPTGSIKDRPAIFIIDKLLKSGKISKETAIIESSSGNFGISLATYCKINGLKFYCVIDPNISKTNEYLLNQLSTGVIKVLDKDKSGGYLINRIKKVKKFLNRVINSYWVNQYANPDNAQAYYETLGKEICDSLQKIDYIFIGVGSGGTITGVSRKIKEQFPNCKVIAVDTKGSVIFGGKAEKRYIPGIGSSIVPDILKNAKIDEIITIPENDAVKSCHKLLKDHSLFAGGSSGSVFSAIEQYFINKQIKNKVTVVTIFPDRGERYINTIYNKNWCNKFFGKLD
ncbi:MAG: 2,3-diaminopropionate biosynthesis protein SbnA [Minisyncoccia bacterium]